MLKNTQSVTFCNKQSTDRSIHYLDPEKSGLKLSGIVSKFKFYNSCPFRFRDVLNILVLMKQPQFQKKKRQAVCFLSCVPYMSVSGLGWDTNHQKKEFSFPSSVARGNSWRVPKLDHDHFFSVYILLIPAI